MTKLNAQHLVFSSVPVLDRPLFERVAAARKAGFHAMSLLPNDIWDMAEQGTSPEELGKRIRGEGLEISEVDCIASWLPAHATLNSSDPILASLNTTHVTDRVIEAAARVGARSVTVVEILGAQPSLDEASEAFAKVCDKAADQGLLTHIEFLPFGGIPTLERAAAIVQNCGRTNAGLTLDSWHFHRSGATLAQLAAIPGHHIHTVQLNDAPVEPWANLFEETMQGRLLPGQGSFDLTGLIQTLDQIGSTAPIEIEVFHTRQADLGLDQIAEEWMGSLQSALSNARKI